MRHLWGVLSKRSRCYLFLLWLGILSSCKGGEQVAPARYIDLGNEKVWSTSKPAYTSICLRKGGERHSVAISALYDHRVRHRQLKLELKLLRWGQVWATDTVTLNMNEYFDGSKGRRPASYEAKGSELWYFAAPIAGIYKIAARPLEPESPDGVLALGLLELK